MEKEASLGISNSPKGVFSWIVQVSNRTVGRYNPRAYKAGEPGIESQGAQDAVEMVLGHHGALGQHKSPAITKGSSVKGRGMRLPHRAE